MQDLVDSQLFGGKRRVDAPLNLAPQFFEYTLNRIQLWRVGGLGDGLYGQLGSLLATMAGGSIPDDTIELLALTMFFGATRNPRFHRN